MRNHPALSVVTWAASPSMLTFALRTGRPSALITRPRIVWVAPLGACVGAGGGASGAGAPGAGASGGGAFGLGSGWADAMPATPTTQRPTRNRTGPRPLQQSPCRSVLMDHADVRPPA